MKPEPNPVLVEVLRNGAVESAHRGSAVVVDSSGETLFHIGDPDRLIFPRSSIKFLQALPIVESGAADALGLDDQRLALACASHNGEPMHVDAVNQWLAELALDANDLENGPTLPLSEEAAHALIARGETPTRAHQNCSGKHCGMLSVARQLGESARGYSEYDHPSQQAWMTAMGEMCNVDVRSLHWERDGCGLPAVQMSSRQLALGFARFGDSSGLPAARKAAIKRIQDALRRHPRDGCRERPLL